MTLLEIEAAPAAQHAGGRRVYPSDDLVLPMSKSVIDIMTSTAV